MRQALKWALVLLVAAGGSAANGAAPTERADYGPRVLSDFADGTAQGWTPSNSTLTVSRERAYGNSRYSLRVEPGQWGAAFMIQGVDLSQCRALKFQLWGEPQPGKEKLWPQLWINGDRINGWIGSDPDGGLPAGKWSELTVDLRKHRDIRTLAIQVYDANPLFVGQVWGDALPPAGAAGKSPATPTPAAAAPAPAASPPGTAARSDRRVTVHDTRVLHTSPAAFHGTNFVALWNKTGDSSGAVRAFSQMGLALVRFPGGVPAQWYDWETPLASGWTVLTPERAWKFADAGGARMLFQTNTATNEEDRNQETGQTFRFDNSPAHQAAWVKFCRSRGIEVAFWEIGNEPEMDAPEEHKHSQEAVYAWYNRVFQEQARALKQADPRARVMGPAATNTWFWWAQQNLEKFLQAHGNRQGTGLVDAVSLHWYPDGGAGPWEQKRAAAQEWADCMQYIREVLAKYDTRDLPLYLTEWNRGAGDKNDSGAQLANALGNADCVGMFLRTGVAGHTHFCLQRIQRGWGVLAGGCDDRRADDEPSPTYFALAMVARLKGEVLATRVSADERHELSAYATRDPAGAVCVMLVNKTGRPLSVHVDFAQLNPTGRTLQLYSLQGISDRLEDEQVIYNGLRNPQPSRMPLPPPRASVVRQRSLVQPMPPYSLVTLSLVAR